MRSGNKVIFDAHHAVAFTEARMKFLDPLLPLLIEALQLRTAVDAGCGVGYFSNYLFRHGLEVVGFDGRSSNVVEAQRRHPSIRFAYGNVEDFRIRELGEFDLALCFGLLYHLENPFAAIRNLFAMTKKLLLIESIVGPSPLLSAEIVQEPSTEDQGLNYVAFVPSEAALVKILYIAGFPHVYGFKVFPDHMDFRETDGVHRKRTMLAATKVPLSLPIFNLLVEPPTRDLWLKAPLPISERLLRFMKKPLKEKLKTVQSRLHTARSWLC